MGRSEDGRLDAVGAALAVAGRADQQADLAMTRDDALTVTEYVMNAWAKPDWEDDHAALFVSGLMPYDAELATNAIAMAHTRINFRPSFAEFLEFYRAAKAEAESRQKKPTPKRTATNKMPVWVRRWICARYLYVKYGKPQDMRTFPEQGDYGDPTVPLMPEDEWQAEAAAIGDREAMKAIQHTA